MGFICVAEKFSAMFFNIFICSSKKLNISSTEAVLKYLISAHYSSNIIIFS